MRKTSDQVYVSITGLTLKSLLYAVPFWWHASQSFSQATRAKGNLFADARRVGDVHHTLTIWTSRDAMRAYLGAGPHRRALKAYQSIGSGRVHGYYADIAPGWDEALRVWEREARAV